MVCWGKERVMNLRKVAITSFLIGVFFVVQPCLAADHASEQNAKVIGTSEPAQVQKPDAAPPKSGKALRQVKHGQYGLKCNVCHESDEPSTSPKTEKCINCHGEQVKKVEQPKGTPDPHKSHLGELLCGKCHREHRESVFFCNKCHVFDMKVP